MNPQYPVIAPIFSVTSVYVAGRSVLAARLFTGFNPSAARLFRRGRETAARRHCSNGSEVRESKSEAFKTGVAQEEAEKEEDVEEGGMVEAAAKND